MGPPLTCSDLPPVEAGDGRKVDVSDLIHLCRRACNAILEVYTQPEEEWQVEHKGGTEPLTKADLQSNRVLLGGLRDLCPGCLLVSEESTHASAAARAAAEFVWLVDPLDGTKEFIKRNGEFCVNMGLCFRGAPVLGIVGAPVSGAMYVGGEALGGAWELQKEGDRLLPLSCRVFSWGDTGLKVTASSSHSSPDTCAFLARLKQPQMQQIGSALKFLRLACGEAHIYPRFAPCSEWDTCAAHAILRAAGGEIYRWEDAAKGGPLGPLQYNKPSLLNPSFVAVAKLAAGEDECPPPLSSN